MAGRLIAALITLWCAATLSFWLLRLVPGDAISAQLAQTSADDAEIERRRAALGLDAPLLAQYGRYLIQLLRGDMGNSLTNGLPVTELIIGQFVPTAELAFCAGILAVFWGVGIGVAAALHTLKGLNRLARLLIALSVSVPSYWTATLVIYLFSSRLGWLPSNGTGGIIYLILPAGVLAFHASGSIARLVQVNVYATAAAPYILTAHGKGLHPAYILWHHIIPNSIIPVLNLAAIQFGFLLGGTVITESIFVRPGLGLLLLNAAQAQDYPVVQGIVVLSALTYTLLNLAANMLQAYIDPRISP